MTNTIEQGNIQGKALNDAIQSIRSMSAGRRFRVEEWENFFQQNGIMEIISQEKFLRELGDCFTMKAVDNELYRILMEQLSLVESYRQSRKIDLTSSTGSNPLTYAESKLKCANYRYNKKRKYRKYTIVDTILWILQQIVTQFY